MKNRGTYTAVVLLCALGVTGCATAEPTVQLIADIDPPQPLRMAVVGDSISAGTQLHMEVATDTGTWAFYAEDRPEVDYVGGWAEAGSTSTYQAQNVYPVDSDVLVVMTGTNDFHTGIGWEQHSIDLDHIVTTIGAPNVVVLALPPINYLAPLGVVDQRNVLLQGMCTDRGWAFIDPWSKYRNGARWVEGAAPKDGVHPTIAVHERAGQIIGEYLASSFHSTG